MNNEFELQPLLDDSKEENIKYVVNFENTTYTLKDIFPEPVSPQQMIQVLWKFIIDNNLLKQRGPK